MATKRTRSTFTADEVDQLAVKVGHQQTALHQLKVLFTDTGYRIPHVRSFLVEVEPKSGFPEKLYGSDESLYPFNKKLYKIMSKAIQDGLHEYATYLRKQAGL